MVSSSAMRVLGLRLLAALLVVLCLCASLGVAAPLDDFEGFGRDVRAPKGKFIRFGRAGQKFIRFGRGGEYGPETSFPALVYPDLY